MWDGWCVGKLNEESWRRGSQKSEPPRYAGRRRQCRGLSGCGKPHFMGRGGPSLCDETASGSEVLDFLPTIPTPNF